MCVDELDKMPRQFQEKLLNFMESGHIKVDQVRRQYDLRIKGAKVFAACNEITRLSRPLSRFRCLHLPPYTKEQFLEVSVKVLPKLKIAHVIGKAVWEHRGEALKDMRHHRGQAADFRQPKSWNTVDAGCSEYCPRRSSENSGCARFPGKSVDLLQQP